jgi:hypothetical protein
LSICAGAAGIGRHRRVPHVPEDTRRTQSVEGCRHHPGLSALIGATVVVVMLTLWYPRPYFDAMGGQALLALIVGVDVTLGPLLTLIVFNPKKQELKFDLAVIAACQLTALSSRRLGDVRRAARLRCVHQGPLRGRRRE